MADNTIDVSAAAWINYPYPSGAEGMLQNRLNRADRAPREKIIARGYNLDSRYLQEEIYTVAGQSILGQKRSGSATKPLLQCTPWVDIVGVQWITFKWYATAFVGSVFLQWVTSVDDVPPGSFETTGSYRAGHQSKDAALTASEMLFNITAAATDAKEHYRDPINSSNHWGTHVRLYTVDDTAANLKTAATSVIVAVHLQRMKNTVGTDGINYQFGQSQKALKRGE